MQLSALLSKVCLGLGLVLLLLGLVASSPGEVYAASDLLGCQFGTCKAGGTPASPTDPTGCTIAGSCDPTSCDCKVGVTSRSGTPQCKEVCLDGDES